MDPHKEKYHPLYWSMAYAAATMSVATRHQVGAIVVTPTGMISVGWNGMPAGLPNECETYWAYDLATNQSYRKTNPEVIHAERNAIDKMTRQGVPTLGSVLFVTRSPCFECAKALHGLGLAAIHYDELHDDTRGLALLEATGTPVVLRGALRALGEAPKEDPYHATDLPCQPDPDGIRAPAASRP